MKAVGLYRYLPINDPQSLVDVEIPKPEAKGRDLLVRVHAISVNPVDTKVRSPKDQVEESPRILGWDVAGVVEQAGEECSLFKVGDEVYYAGTIVRPGCNSEFHLIDERIVGRKPKNLDFAQAAALPLTAVTAAEAIFDRLEITLDTAKNAGKTILIIGAAGGVGSLATQYAKLAGLTVIGTASRPETVQWAKEHGAEYVINHHEAFAPQLKKFGFATVDYIFCLNDTARHWDNLVETIVPQGRICSIVETPGPLPLSDLQGKSATFVWELMFTRSIYQTPDMIEQHNILNQLADLIESGTFTTTLTERISPINAENLRKAHAKLESGSTIGKVVLENW
ncbi:MAG TPA: zinc-binding alcohol dehydrogenase family protein [Dictyobacter sp.]|jgi:zinc-binding alcohol dehydrogenase family protein|nr:zinc-binding alcohol dehydrogenase family protein [Dictyobacter sp.]